MPPSLAVIAHVENEYGIFAVEGGIYRLAEALERRARALGVDIVTGTEVDEIVVERAAGGLRTRGVRTDGELHSADCVVANCDIADAWGRLLAGVPPVAPLARKYAAEELSLSAYVLVAVAAPPPFPLVHHNVFFSRDYPREFEELVTERRPPADPTVYVCAEPGAGGYF